MHYKVLAITATDSEHELHEAMGPYDENLEVEPYVAETKDEFLTRNLDWARKLAAELSKLDADPKALEDAMRHNRSRTEWLTGKEGGRRIAAAASMDEGAAYAAFRARYESGGTRFDDEGNRLSTYNPKAKYDYYDPCDGFLPLLKGGAAEDADASEVDWDRFLGRDEASKADAEEFWRRHVLGEPYPGMTAKQTRKKVNEEYGPLLYGPEWYLKVYGDLEGYLASGYRTYAVMDGIKGEWHAPGRMGWFSSSEDPEEWGEWVRSYRKRFVDTLPPGCHVWFLDLHI